jgi:hypothetical protein
MQKEYKYVECSSLASYLSFFATLLLAFEKIPRGIHACSVGQMDGHVLAWQLLLKRGTPYFQPTPHSDIL